MRWSPVALALVATLRPSAGDGGCRPGWTRIDDACFRVTEGSQSFDSSVTACSSLSATATLATLVHEDQNWRAAQLLSESAWIGYVVSDAAWVDGSKCLYRQDFEQSIASTRICTRLIASSSKWTQSECESISPALCSYPLLTQRNCTCAWRYEVLPGYCEPNSFAVTLCSVSSTSTPLADTCTGDFAPNNLPVYGDWSRETGFAYLHPDSCDEDCIQRRCNKDPACKGYSWALGAFDGRGAASLKNSISGSTTWVGYSCKVKSTTCEDQIPMGAASSGSVSATLALLLLAGHLVIPCSNLQKIWKVQVALF